MPRKTINLKVEPEDIELLDRVAKETDKPVDQLILEAVKATYSVSSSSESDTSAAVVKALAVLNIQIEMLRAVVELQGQQIRLLSGNARFTKSQPVVTGTVTGNATGNVKGKPTKNSALHERGVDTERQHRENHERHTRSQGTA